MLSKQEHLCGIFVEQNSILNIKLRHCFVKTIMMKVKKDHHMKESAHLRTLSAHQCALPSTF